jgi:hypothetical protein
MKNFYPNLKITPRRPRAKFSVFYRWGIEICNTKHGHMVWLANLLDINYASIGIKFPMRFRYTKFFYGAQHRHLKIGFLYLNWGFYTKIHAKIKYKVSKNDKTKKNTRSKKGI